MNNISTIHSPSNNPNNQESDEINEFKNFFEKNVESINEVFDYLDTLKCDVSDKNVIEILQFARNYQNKIQNRARAAIG